jgi:DNA-directed RNA polymerase specialized sigma24 family protein
MPADCCSELLLSLCSSAEVKAMGLTQQAFDSLLAKLDADRDGAGRKYEVIRGRLVKFFEVRGCLRPEDLADETINRAAKRILEGAAVAQVLPYSLGVARLVFIESLRDPETRGIALEELPATTPPTDDPDPRTECFETCLESLTAQDREMILAYYCGDQGIKINNRKRLAERTGIGQNALRIRTHRIRGRLEQCVQTCLSR